MNDWRLTGQEEYLFNVELKKISQEEIKNKSDFQNIRSKANLLSKLH